MTAYTEAIAPVDRAIAEELIQETPETWPEATLSVVSTRDETTPIQVEIRGPEESTERVGAGPYLCELLIKHYDVSRQHGVNWSGLTYAISLTEEGDWRYRVHYHYEQ
ncbi:hypothetical protein [Achromobacter sp. AONIH1]|uniref:hypothetical protein n=1 Tax=Achromobacter sp. AONIH1 TaxID=1758194 RepID=UPI00131A0906|nr:hypothetical protein [Achromobacter sp. AONIH1]